MAWCKKIFAMKLNSIKMELQGEVFGDDKGCKNVNVALINLISSSKETLESINFDVLPDCDFKIMETIQIPNLKKVRAWNIVSSAMEDGLVKFLENQQPLEHLDIFFQTKCPTVFMKYLRTKSASLQTFSLASYFFETLSDWSFLEKCSNLREFAIYRQRQIKNSTCREMKETGLSFLTFLPPTVTNLSIQGLKDFWTPPSERRAILDANKNLLLSRFPAMTKLNLTGCIGAVNDLVVQTIIAKMPKLQVLKFSHGSCTDFALSGIKNGDLVGVSLTQLKGTGNLQNCTYESSILNAIINCPLLSFPI